MVKCADVDPRGMADCRHENPSPTRVGMAAGVPIPAAKFGARTARTFGERIMTSKEKAGHCCPAHCHDCEVKSTRVPMLHANMRAILLGNDDEAVPARCLAPVIYDNEYSAIAIRELGPYH